MTLLICYLVCMFFDGEPRPLLHVLDQSYDSPDCDLNTCDLLAGMALNRTTGIGELKPTSYAARTICHGKRPATEKE